MLKGKSEKNIDEYSFIILCPLHNLPYGVDYNTLQSTLPFIIFARSGFLPRLL